jgi:diguanylate cyclase (GGDEF)-like protein/PAS domain S-box-containing protein
MRSVGAAPRALDARVSWAFVAAGTVACALALLDTSDAFRSFAFDALAVIAVGGGVYGILRNRPAQRLAWLLLATGLVLFAAGDVVYDVAPRSAGGNGYPWADVLYLSAYPCIAYGLYRLARRHFRRDTAFDSAIVALGGAAVIWQWVVTPVISTSEGATAERIVTAAYPIMDVILLVVIVHAVFALPGWLTAAWFLFGGLALMLIADVVYARLTADGTYTDGGALDALWPIAYFLLAGAALHPSMRDLWATRDVGLARHSRARLLVLGAALFSVPAIIVIDGAGGRETVALTVIVGITAALVVWRLARLITETDRAREVLTESEARFRAFVQHASDAIGVIDQHGRFSYLSPTASEVLGYPPEAFLGNDVTHLLHPDDFSRALEVLTRVARRPLESEEVVLRVRYADGSWHWIEATFTNQLDQPAVGGIVGNFRDITERTRADAFAARETEVLQLVLHGHPIAEVCDGLLRAVEDYLGDASATIRLVDADTGELRRIASPSLPHDYTDAIDVEMSGIVHDAVDLYQMQFEPVFIADLAQDDRHPSTQQLRSLAVSYGLRALWSMPIRSPDDVQSLGLLVIYVHNAREPTEAERVMMERVRNLVGIALDRAAHTKQLGHLALHDTLTDLPNRALAVERLDAALERLHDRDGVVAVLFLDLDRFKVVNDGLGHDTGDELLVAVGRRLAGSVRRNDTVARFGGDEFVVICEDLTDVRQVEELADRAIRAFAEPFALERTEVVLTASIGIAVTRRASDRAASLLRDADAAMYRAKSLGGARYELFDQAMHTEAVARLLTERGLREALERHELRVLFQPQFELASGARVADEALLRWAHPVRGLVPPSEFIDVAEETGLIVPIGNWVLEQACQHASRTRRDSSREGTLRVSVNVSARQLLRPDFTRTVRAALREFDLDPPSICLEIAEHLLLDDHESTTLALEELKDLGLRLAIDDFGTGGSSLTYLRRYPFDELKIDRTFVAGLEQSAADDAIVAATIDMAHALRMVVTAEGVESELQRVRLVELGCDRGQGYHLAPPEALPARHLELVRQRPA